MEEKKTLTAKERLFCFYSARGYDGRTAAALAGFKIRPQKTAASLLQRQEITEQIKSLAEERGTDLDEVAAGYRRLAFGSVADALCLLYEDEAPDPGRLESLDLINVASIKRPKGGGMEVKFFDRLKALENLRELGRQEAETQNGNPFFKALERGARALAENAENQKKGE